MVKAIDMQVLIPRSHDVGKIQQLEVQKQATQIHYTESELHRMSTLQQASVNKSEHMINDNIRDNREKNKGDRFEGQQDHKGDEEVLEEKEASIVKEIGNIVDIHI